MNLDHPVAHQLPDLVLCHCPQPDTSEQARHCSRSRRQYRIPPLVPPQGRGDGRGFVSEAVPGRRGGQPNGEAQGVRHCPRPGPIGRARSSSAVVEELESESPAKTMTAADGLTVDDARKLLRVARLEMVKSKLRDTGRNCLDWNSGQKTCWLLSSPPFQNRQIGFRIIKVPTCPARLAVSSRK
ncbi:unnamed protein product [Linum trigynum]|uniref:Uncharacterized protein n=1 Tax=Linum trigynum TaxID=586398 RepID=A0AAV2FMV4_9ROSI